MFQLNAAIQSVDIDNIKLFFQKSMHVKLQLVFKMSVSLFGIELVFFQITFSQLLEQEILKSLLSKDSYL